jgi:hypothetical protein
MPGRAFSSASLGIGTIEHTREQRADAGNLHQPAADLAGSGSLQDHPVVFEDVGVDQLCGQHRKAGAGGSRPTRVGLVGDDREQGSEPLPVVAATRPSSARCAGIALPSWVRWWVWWVNISRARCSIMTLCCSTVFGSTKRMDGRCTASQMASASFLLPLRVCVHVGRWQQPRVMAERPQLPRPVAHA